MERVTTDKQVQKLFRLLASERSLASSAMKANMDEKTARKYRRLGKLPSEVAVPHTWRTRTDPFAEVWPEVQALLEQSPGLQAKTIFADLQRRYEGRFQDNQLRTLQRHIKHWRASAGPPKEVFFTQVHEPGRLCASDFTEMNSLSITIGGQPFEHLVFHFVLTYSNWETVTICFSESFEALSDGLQNALRELGGGPQRHRTDRMSTAVNNLSDRKEFTRRYQALLDHYGVVGEKIQADHAHENGDAEQRHRRFKDAVDQTLMLRGSRDFASREEYTQFLRTVCRQQNAGRRVRLEEELKVLRSLTARRLESWKVVPCRVDSGSLIHVGRNCYSVPSRLIGENVQVRVYAEHLEVWYAQQCVQQMPRLLGRGKHKVNYRHIIDWLVRKPGAFAHYVYREELFPSSVFRLAYDTMVSQDVARADKEYLKILELAAKGSESEVEAVLRRLLAEDGLLTFAAVAAQLLRGAAPVLATDVVIEATDLGVFDQLLTEQEVNDAEGTGCREAGELAAGVALADDPCELCGSGTAGGEGDAELRAVPAGTVRARESGTADEADRASAARVATAAGEEPGDVRSETAADEAGPASAELARRPLRGPQGEPAGVRQGRLGQDALAVRASPGAGPSRPASVLHNVELASAGVTRGQTRPGAQAGLAETVTLRGVADRRPGLRAAEPGGDGGAVHALGGTLRTWQCVVDQQLAVLEVGEHLQGPDDHSRSHRPAGAPQRDPGVELAQLPPGAGQAGQGPDRRLRVKQPPWPRPAGTGRPREPWEF